MAAVWRPIKGQNTRWRCEHFNSLLRPGTLYTAMFCAHVLHDSYPNLPPTTPKAWLVYSKHYGEDIVLNGPGLVRNTGFRLQHLTYQLLVGACQLRHSAQCARNNGHFMDMHPDSSPLRISGASPGSTRGSSELVEIITQKRNLDVRCDLGAQDDPGRRHDVCCGSSVCSKENGYLAEDTSDPDPSGLRADGRISAKVQARRSSRSHWGHD